MFVGEAPPPVYLAIQRSQYKLYSPGWRVQAVRPPWSPASGQNPSGGCSVLAGQVMHPHLYERGPWAKASLGPIGRQGSSRPLDPGGHMLFSPREF